MERPELEIPSINYTH